MAHAETTNALTMKLLALATAVDGPRREEVRQAIAALPMAFFAEREGASKEIESLKGENELLKQRLAQEVLVNSGRVPAPPSKISTPVAPRSINNSRQCAFEGRRLHVGNLSHSTTEHDLKEFFRGFTFDGVDLIPHTHKPGALGYGFVNIATATEAQRACQVLNGRVLLGRRIHVQLAKADFKFSTERDHPASIPHMHRPSITRDPRRLTPPASIRASIEGPPPAKRQRSDSATSLPIRRPRCVGCYQIGAHCDGKPVCGVCLNRNYGCEYNECWDLLGCNDVNCSRLHPEQWSRSEEPRRKVKSWKA